MLCFHYLAQAKQRGADHQPDVQRREAIIDRRKEFFALAA
jgi:hypothetical protein